MKLSMLDMNLLLVLHLVLREQSVARAARELHVTPSAVSNSLSRLRAIFGDPLLVRSGRGLAPTPLALALAPELEAAIRGMERALELSTDLRPEQVTRVFTLACTDVDQICSAPAIARLLAERMPRASLQVASVDQLQAGGGLAGGAADAAIGPAGPLTAGHHAVDLYRDDAVLVVRRGHPRVTKHVGARTFNELGHVDVTVALGRGGVGHQQAEGSLGSEGLRRRVVVTVPTFIAAAVIASRSDLAAGIPRRLAERFAAALDLNVLSLPGRGVSFQLQLHWHDRTHADRTAAAFREVVVRALRETEASPPAQRRSRTGSHS